MQHDTNPSAYQGNPDSLKRCRRAAALQAAAPDLLAALRAVADDSIAMRGFHEEFRAAIRAAIAKATT
jgi:hypothetical protein